MEAGTLCPQLDVRLFYVERAIVKHAVPACTVDIGGMQHAWWPRLVLGIACLTDGLDPGGNTHRRPFFRSRIGSIDGDDMGPDFSCFNVDRRRCACNRIAQCSWIHAH